MIFQNSIGLKKSRCDVLTSTTQGWICTLFGPCNTIYMANWVAFKGTQGKSLDIFSFVITYWHTFESACQTNEPSNGSNKAKVLHDTIEVKTFVQVCKWTIHLLYKQQFFLSKKTCLITLLILKAINAILIYVTSNNPMVTCFSS